MTTKLILLGTGSPRCLPNVYQSGTAVLVNDTPFILDCGGGIVQRLAVAAVQNPALALGNLQHLVITHLHPDHTAGIADFIISTWIRERKAPLQIYGPKGIKKMVALLIEAYEIGIAEHWETVTPTSWPLLYDVHEYQAGKLLELAGTTITAMQVVHGRLEAYALKFETPDKTIVISGDTNKQQVIIDAARGCDILLHECYSKKGLDSSHYPEAYFGKVHTSTIELAEIGHAARPKLIVLTHQMHLGPVSDEAFVAEITDLYDGEVIFGRDLDVFE